MRSTIKVMENEKKRNPEASEQQAELDSAVEIPSTATDDSGAVQEDLPEIKNNDGAACDDNTEANEKVIADLKDKLLRALADTENLRRRSQKEKEDALRYSAASFARDMLAVADNLRRAIDSLPEDPDPQDTTLTNLLEGISLTEKELLSTLQRHGITAIDPKDKKFDPQFHEAMFEIPMPGVENGIVVQVIEIGYLIHDRLLRPAKVGVAKTIEEPTKEEQGSESKANGK